MPCEGSLTSDTNKRRSRQNHLTSHCTREPTRNPPPRRARWLLRGGLHFSAEKATLETPGSQLHFYQVSKGWELVGFFPLLTDDHSPFPLHGRRTRTFKY